MSSPAAAVLLPPRLWLLLGLLMACTLSCSAPVQETAIVRGPSDPEGYRGGTTVPEPYRMPDRTLTDTSGHDYHLLSSPSKPVTLLFFGYTHCPDVCLGVLSDVASALGRLPAGSRDQVDLIFVTTDPARDTGPAIERYLKRFDPSFIGLTGDLATIKSVAEAVGVDIQGRRLLPGGGYQVGHSAQVVGFDRNRRGVVLWTPSTPIGDLTADFELLVARQR